MPEMIDTSTMPGDMMDPDAIEAGAGKLRTVGSQVSTQGGTVLTSWQKISASYDAPEENTLFQAMNPVKTAAEKVGTDTGSAATALETFAEEVRTIKAAVAQIRREAAAFKADVAGGVEVTSYNWKTGTSSYTQDWHEDQASVDKNNALISRTNDQQEALWKAERTCANAIRALVGLSPISAASESNPDGYGVDSIPDGTEMPWGAKVERTEGCGEGIVHGAVNGVSNFAGGVTSLFGLRNSGEGLWGWDWNWDWSWGNLGETWAGIGKFAIGAATTGLVGTPVVLTMPGPVGDFLRDSQKTFAGGVAGLVAIDIYADDPLHNWKEHGWRALGESGFNIATIVVPASKIGSLGKVGRVGEVALNITDPLYLATRAAQGLKVLTGPTVESLLRIERAVDLDTGLKVSTKIDIDVPAVNRDGVHTDLPNTSGPDVDAPPARDYTDQPSTRDVDATPADHAPHDTSSQTHEPSSANVDDGAGHPVGHDDATPDQSGPGTDGEVGSHHGGDVDSGTSPAVHDVGSGHGTVDDPRVYGYENRAEQLRGTPEPHVDDLGDLGPSKQYDSGTQEHMEARWSEYLDKKAAEGKAPYDWDRWRDNYISNQGHDARGRAFEQAFWTDRQFDPADGWQQNHDVKHDVSSGVSRNYDIVSVKEQTAFELKSGATADNAQIAKDAALVRDGWDITYVFGSQPSQTLLDRLSSLGIDVEIYHAKAVLVP